VRRLFSFSKGTFVSLSLKKQHKKCSELVKELYLHPEDADLQHMYQQLCCWMNLPYTNIDLEKRFHDHLKQAGQGIAEHNFLKNLTTKDTPSKTPWLKIYTYLDGLRSCHNVGSIIRTVEAFRLGPVHLSSDMMEKNHPQIQNTSMGTWPLVSISHGAPKETLPRPWVGVETVSGAVPWNEYSYPKECTLLLGNEERGICPELLSSCDAVVTIPLVGQKNSLNVANAFAIIAAQISWQQRA
jgi:tRNA G18 (ribose-2'-O)-methylase SpoU